MRVAIIIHEGLGNTLLLVPLIKRLKEANKKVFGVFTSRFNTHELFTDISLFEEKILIQQNSDYIKVAAKYVQKFDEIYLDWFASNRKNMLLANSIAKKIITNKIPDKLPSILSKRINYIEPLKGIHEISQNLRLYDNENLLDKLNLNDLLLKVNKRNLKILKEIPDRYAVVQFSAGNNNAKYKTWPLKNWSELFIKIHSLDPDLKFLLLGDQNEMGLAKKITFNANKNTINLAGKTSINEAVHIINNSTFYLGIDSGLMHLSVNLNKPTFTLWGASDYNLFGYEKFRSNKHQLLYKKIPCHPCNSYINPNQTRVSNPNDCPDFKCIANISVEETFKKFKKFLADNKLI